MSHLVEIAGGATLLGGRVNRWLQAALGASLVILFALFGYVLLAIWKVKQAIRRAPREEMFICDEHGPMSPKVALELFDDLEVQMTDGSIQRKPLRACPICFEKKIRAAKEKYK